MLTEQNDGIRYDSDFARIEELIKGNTFTREEITCLMGILNSRVDKEEEHKPSSNAEGNAQLVLRMPELLKTPSEGKHQYIERTVIGGYREKTDVPVGVSASPIDIARAYMAGRTIEEGQYLNNSISNSERPHQPNEFTRKPLLLPSASPKPSICWPGAVVHDRHGYSTPQSQRARNRLHDFPRTPYSRAMPSKSTTKLQADSGYANTSTPFQKSQTPLYGQGILRGEPVDAYGSVGPIRRIRNKFSSEVRPRGSIFLSSPKEIPPKVSTAQAFESFLPSAENNLVRGETSGTSNYWSGDNVSHPSARGMSSANKSSGQAARKAAELLDRNKPTPKQKEAELKLVTALGSSPNATDLANVENRTSVPVEEPASHLSGPNFTLEFNKSSSKFSFLGDFQGKGTSEAGDASTGIAKESSSIFTDSSNSIPGAQANNWNKNALATDHKQRETSLQFSRRPPSNGQDAKIMTEAEASKNHGAKPSLPSISTNRLDFRAAFSNNGPSFTFPISASAGVLSELPTPSVSPSSSSSIISLPMGTPSIPSYSFGSKKTAPSVVFSFPSTSSASNSNHEDTDLKFSFGSEKKIRLSFSCFGKDAICNY